MGLGERIAKVLAPEAVTLTTEYIARLRLAYADVQRRVAYLKRENKRLLKEIMRLKKRNG